MPTFVALLRGINVGGRTMIPMSELRGLFESVGCAEVKTLLHSGNVVFRVPSAKAGVLESRLENALVKKGDHEVDVLIRDAKEWNELIAKNPFRDEATRTPGHLVAMCLKAGLAALAEAELQKSIVGRERCHAGERCLYIHYPDGMGRTKFTTALIERKLGTSGTARNWNTVLKIAALL